MASLSVLPSPSCSLFSFLFPLLAFVSSHPLRSGYGVSYQVYHMVAMVDHALPCRFVTLKTTLLLWSDKKFKGERIINAVTDRYKYFAILFELSSLRYS